MSAPLTQTPLAAAMERADALLRQMTIEEKAMQLSPVVPLAPIFPIVQVAGSDLVDALRESDLTPTEVRNLRVEI